MELGAEGLRDPGARRVRFADVDVVVTKASQRQHDAKSNRTCPHHQDGPRQVNMQLWNWRGIDVINAHERDPAVYIQGIREAVQAVSSGVLNPSRLYTHTFPLDQLDQAFRIMEERPDGFLKALVLA